MNDKELRKFYRRQFAPVSWWLVGYYVLMNAAIYVSWIIHEIVMNPTEAELMGNAWGYLAACIIGMLILLLWKGIPFWKDKVWARGRAMEFKDFLILLMLTIGCQLWAVIGMNILELLFSGTGYSAEASVESATSQPDTFSMFLYAGVFAPVFEELIFRGFAMQTLKPYGKKFAILGSAILFGLFHGNLFQSPYALLVGLVFGYAAMEYSLGWAMLLHMINNLVVADMLSRVTSYLPETAAGVVTMTVLLAFAVAGMVILIRSREKIRTWRKAEVIHKTYLGCFFGSAGVICFLVVLGGMMIYTLTVLISPM